MSRAKTFCLNWPRPLSPHLSPDAGLPDRAVQDNTVPKIMYILSSSGYWARNALLLQTTIDGRQPVALGADGRLYYFAGVAHALRFPGQFTETGKEAACPYNANVDLADGPNAQLENLRKWVVDNIAPPPTVAPVPGVTLIPAAEHWYLGKRGAAAR